MKVEAGKPYRIQLDYVQEKGFAALSFDIQHKVTISPEELLREIGNTETVVFVGGISPSLEGEEMKVSEPGFKGGDRTNIELPQSQRDILALLHKAGKKVIFVNCSGSAVALTPELQSCDAILQWWYAGEKGGEALAQVLFGDKSPSGKLPVTFYKSTDELPDFLDYTMKNRTYRYYTGEPLFPFGYGLSYTTFTYGDLALDATSMTESGKITATVKVTNTGNYDGTEVVQLYIRDMVGSISRPVKELKGFERVSLKKGESRDVTFEITADLLKFYNSNIECEPGEFQVMVGGDSRNVQTANFTLE